VPVLRPTYATPLVRTHFGADEAWVRLQGVIGTPSEEGFLAGVDVVEDAGFDGLGVDAVLAALPDDLNQAVLFIADVVTLTDPELPLLAVRLLPVPGQTFRVIPPWLWAVENNLSSANLGWEDFAEHLDADGVFRGL
jgi:hypothetical protein